MKVIYIAIPYSGIERNSFKIANAAARYVLEQGNIPFSPISMCHPIVEETSNYTQYTNPLLGDWKTWESIDKKFIDMSDELYYVYISEFINNNSIGINGEIEYAKSKNIPIKKMKFNYNESIDEYIFDVK